MNIALAGTTYDYNDLESLSKHIETHNPTLSSTFKRYCVHSIAPVMDAGYRSFSEIMSRTRSGDNGHGTQFLIGLEVLRRKEEQEQRVSELVETLKDSFSHFYIDPHNYTLSTADTLKKMMDTYHEDPRAYVAPCTSLVSSSMMGKSRLMKEMSKYIPCIYICLRSGAIGSSGYPQRSSQIVEWFEEPLCKIAPELKPEDIESDFEHHLPPLKYAAFLVSLITSLANLASIDNDDLFTNDLHIERSHLRWMWEFFAEPSNSLTEGEVEKFWKAVISNATDIFRTNFDNREAYIAVNYRSTLSASYARLESAFKRWIPKDSFTLVLLFDEARPLCDISAYDGKNMLSDDSYDEQGHLISRPDSDTAFVFSNLRALRRALRYPLLCEQDIRIFSLFTDIPSCTSDFQPHAAFDRSSRMFTGYPPGIKQFEPIFAFTSLDAHARLHCSGRCLSDIYEVSDPERLIKFGRAGWYSTYLGKMKEKGYFFDMASMTRFAGNKLLCLPYDSRSDLEALVRNQSARMNSKLQLKLLALLGVRLDIAAGPFTSEARELVASHLAVIIDVKPDHQSYLKTAYSSEPILAAVASQYIAQTGWHAPLIALCHYIASAVVSSEGFHGELLTKVICLMTMDEVVRSVETLPKSPPSPPNTQSSPNTERPSTGRVSSRARLLKARPAPASESRPITPVPPYRWRYAQPVKVSQFLDHLLAAPRGHVSFSSALIAKQKNLSLNSAKLQKFLDGYVFFNHFMHLDTRLSIEIIARAWNRGAALSCKEYTTGFDLAIPVMLAQPGTETAFGPMFDCWTPEEIKEGCRHMSIILIHTKNYADATDQQVRAWNNAPTTTNFDNKEELDKEKNIYLSLLQDFGPIHGTDEGTVTIRSRKDTREKPEHQQIVVIVKGFDCQTYKCLGNSNPISEDNATFPNKEVTQRQLIQRSIEQLKTTIEFCDKDRNEDDRRFLAVKEGFFALGLAGKRYREEWATERSKFSASTNQDIDVEMTGVEPVPESKKAKRKYEDRLHEMDCE